MQILQQLIQGLSLGSIYGLVALGYVLIYQAWGVLNFAQGEVCAIGAFSLLVLHVELGMPVIPGHAAGHHREYDRRLHYRVSFLRPLESEGYE